MPKKIHKYRLTAIPRGKLSIMEAGKQLYTSIVQNNKENCLKQANISLNILSRVYTNKFVLTNFICQRYFVRLDEEFVG